MEYKIYREGTHIPVCESYTVTRSILGVVAFPLANLTRLLCVAFWEHTRKYANLVWLYTHVRTAF